MMVEHAGESQTYHLLTSVMKQKQPISTPTANQMILNKIELAFIDP
jgi:hypothetical protein